MSTPRSAEQVLGGAPSGGNQQQQTRGLSSGSSSGSTVRRKHTTGLGASMNCIPAWFSNNCFCYQGPRQHQMRIIVHTCDTIMHSVYWRALIVIFTIVLLFGSPIQFLAFPKEADPFFDVLYTIAFVIFCFDMIFNLIVDPEYFGFDLLTRKRKTRLSSSSSSAGQQQQQHPPPTIQQYHSNHQNLLGCWPCGIGSFMFWCDVGSTGALLFDISYINTLEYATRIIDLNLDEYGVPVRDILSSV